MPRFSLVASLCMLLSGFMLTSSNHAAAGGDGGMFENGVQDASAVCGYHQLNDAGHIEVYCIEPSSDGSETTSYSVKCGSAAAQTGVSGAVDNCQQTDAVSALVKNAYCMEPRPDGDQLPDSYQFVTDRQYQMGTGADGADGSLYRLEANQAYQLDSSDVDMAQASHDVNADSGTGSLVLQCVEYVDGGNSKCDGGDDPITHTFQAANVPPQVPEGSYEIVMLPDGSKALREIQPATNANSGVNVKQMQVVEAADMSGLVTPVMSSSVVSGRNSTGSQATTMVMAAETPTRGNSSYIILPSTLMSKSGLEGSPTTVVYQLADRASIIQGNFSLPVFCIKTSDVSPCPCPCSQELLNSRAD